MMDMLKNETNGLYSFNHIRSLILLITLPLLSSIKISDDVKPVDNETGKVYFIPQPESVKIGVGYFSLVPTTKIFLPQKFIDDLGPYIKEKIKNDAGLNVHVAQWNKTASSNYIRFDITEDPSIAKEGYTLKITSKEINIKATTYAGFFNAFQTLRQTIDGDTKQLASKSIHIPCMEVTDKPRFEWRGLMLDVSRHFQTKEFVKKQIDIISSYKTNKFHWHLSDDQGWRVEIKKYPNLTNKGAWRADRTGIHWWNREFRKPEEATTIGGFYTQDDIKEVVEYARIRNVEVIPEIDIPGHSKALIASYPFLTCRKDVLFEVSTGGRSPNNALCAGKETTYEFINDVLSELTELFPSKYIHIGGDECNKNDWAKCEHCTKTVKEHGLKDLNELQSHFISRINKQIISRGKTLIGWDEILDGKGAPKAIIMAWRRNRYSPEVDAPRAGYKTIQASYLHSYINNHQGPVDLEPEAPRGIIPLKKVYQYEPIPEGLTKEEAKLIMGSQVCLWGEFTPTSDIGELMLYPRVLANAEVGWTDPSLKNWTRFQHGVEMNFKRLDRDRVIYSRSMYNPFISFAADSLELVAKVHFFTDSDLHNVRFTKNGSEPTVGSTKYTGVFNAELNAVIKAAIFDEKGNKLGQTVTRTLSPPKK